VDIFDSKIGSARAFPDSRLLEFNYIAAGSASVAAFDSHITPLYIAGNRKQLLPYLYYNRYIGEFCVSNRTSAVVIG